ncbi:MAG: hypothetical protein Tsb002_00070 [Wenzhouxiangellaceae bacterium]
MSLRERFFKPRWQHRDDRIRAGAVAEDNDTELRRQLPRIALEDAAAAVRAAAIGRLSRIENLLPAAMRESDAEVRELALSRLWPMLLKAQPAPAEAGQLVVQLGEGQRLRELALQASDPHLRQLALSRCEAPGFLAECVLTDPLAANRLIALERITQPSTLRQLVERLRRSDKKLHRRAQELLAQVSDGETEANRSLAIKLCQQAEALARGQGVQSLRQQIEQLRDDWSACHCDDEAIKRRFMGAMAILEQALAGPAPIIEEQAAAPEAVAAEPEPEAVVQATADSEASTTPRPALQQLEQQLQRLREQLARGQASAIALRRWQQRWTREWGDGRNASADEQQLAARVAGWWGEIEQHQKHERAQRQALREQLQQQLDAMADALEKGQLSAAVSADQRCRDQLQQLPGRVPQRYRELHHKLNELRRWQRWSNQQRRRQLIDELAAVDPEQLHPDAVMQLLREARREWQQLDEQERACGLPGGHRLWPRFDAACQPLAQRAQPFIDKRQQVRSERATVLRERLQRGVELLRSDDEAPAAAHGELLEQRRSLVAALRELNGVPFDQRTALAKDIRDQLQHIDNILKQRDDDTLSRKQALINAAAALAEAPLSDAINQAKTLQRQWQTAGRLRRSKDQALWKQFRSHIDPLFEQLQQARKQREQEQQQQQVGWQELLAEAEDLLAGSLATAELISAWRPLEQRWQQAAVKDGELHKRWQQLSEQIEQRQQQAATEAERARSEQYWVQARMLQDWAEARLSGDPAALPDDVNPSDDQQALTALSAEALAEALALRAVRATELCIAIEYLAGLESPPEQQEARMQYQVQRLAARLGQGEQQLAPREELQQMVADWLAALPLMPADYQPLEARFKAAWDVATKTL